MVEFRSALVGATRRRALSLGYDLQCRDGLFALIHIATNSEAMGFGSGGAPEASLQQVLDWLDDADCARSRD